MIVDVVEALDEEDRSVVTASARLMAVLREVCLHLTNFDLCLSFVIGLGGDAGYRWTPREMRIG